MSSSPNLKVYDANGKYQASCKEPEAAGALASFYGKGATIRYGHGKLVLWREGEDGVACESYDLVAELVASRTREIHDRNYDRIYGQGEAAKVRAKAVRT